MPCPYHYPHDAEALLWYRHGAHQFIAAGFHPNQVTVTSAPCALLRECYAKVTVTFVNSLAALLFHDDSTTNARRWAFLSELCPLSEHLRREGKRTGNNSNGGGKMNRQVSPAKGDFRPPCYTKAGARIEITRQGVRTFRAKTTEQ